MNERARRQRRHFISQGSDHVCSIMAVLLYDDFSDMANVRSLLTFSFDLFPLFLLSVCTLLACGDAP